MSQLNSWLHSHLQSVTKSYWKRCYKASQDGWSSQTFHRHCDDLGPTVTIIQAHGYIFGGYTDKPWKCAFETYPYNLLKNNSELSRSGVLRSNAW